MSLTLRVLAGLLLGLAAGALVGAVDHPALLALVPVVEPLGALWLNALRMTVVPLVVSLLVTGIAEASAAARAGRLGGRALLVIASLLTAAGLFRADTGSHLRCSPVPNGFLFRGGLEPDLLEMEAIEHRRCDPMPRG